MDPRLSPLERERLRKDGQPVRRGVFTGDDLEPAGHPESIESLDESPERMVRR